MKMKGEEHYSLTNADVSLQKEILGMKIHGNQLRRGAPGIQYSVTFLEHFDCSALLCTFRFLNKFGRAPILEQSYS